MCPVCVGSALLLLTAAGSAGGLAGGLALLASRDRRSRSQEEDREHQSRMTDTELPVEKTAARNGGPPQLQ